MRSSLWQTSPTVLGTCSTSSQIRHVTQKPLVQLIVEGQEPPFDVKAMRTVFYNMTDPFKTAENKTELDRHVEAAESGEPLETPISNALELKTRRESGDSVERAVAGLQSEVAELRAELRASRRTPAQPSSSFYEGRAAGAMGPTGPAMPTMFNPAISGFNKALAEKFAAAAPTADQIAGLQQALLKIQRETPLATDAPPTPEEES